jgi:hypothetical protein
MAPVVSVVVVSDYGSGQAKGWEDLRATLAALSNQDFTEPAEFLLAENAEFEPQIPADLKAILPSLKTVPSPSVRSYDLKNDGARAASADIIALLDGDCVPDASWLRHLVGALRAHPEVTAVSGRTVYAERNLVERFSALLDRAYVDQGTTGPTRFIQASNAAFRGEFLKSHPLPSSVGAFSGRLYCEAIRREGARFLFEPGMRVVHEYEGWPMERDIRRNKGYEAIAARRIDPNIHHAWVTRLGYGAIPIILGYRILLGWSRCLRLGPHYGIAWYQVPVGLVLSVVLQALEIPGMIDAIHGRPLESTAYR